MFSEYKFLFKPRLILNPKFLWPLLLFGKMNLFMTGFNLYPHMGWQIGQISNHSQIGKKVFNYVLVCFWDVYLTGNYFCPWKSNYPWFPILEGNSIFFSWIGRTKTFFNFPQLCSPKFFSMCTSVTIPMSWQTQALIPIGRGNNGFIPTN